MTEDRLHIEIIAIKNKVASLLEKYSVIHAENIELKSEIERLKVVHNPSLTQQNKENQIVENEKQDFTIEAKGNDVETVSTFTLHKKQWEEKLTTAIDDIDQCLQIIQSRN
ncbi:MAG: hypothetical protein R2774_08620 [Saprospiraceae bacterium]